MDQRGWGPSQEGGGGGGLGVYAFEWKGDEQPSQAKGSDTKTGSSSS